MTCIIGGKYVEGVVLVGDRKIFYAGQPPSYREKIRKDYTPIVTSGAGKAGLYDTFQTKALEQLQDQTEIAPLSIPF